MTDTPAGPTPSVPDGVAIRPATDADGPALAALIASVFTDYENCPFLPEEFPELAAPATHYAGKGGILWVAEAAGQVVGSLAVAPSWRAGEVELFKVYLARAWRGRGIAGELLARAEAFARAVSARRVALWSDTRFAEGHRFYRRRGFRQVPGARALHDAAESLEFAFARDVPPETAR